MANDGKARPLAAIVGDGLKTFREQRQLRQSDLATAAEKAGLSWSRSSIAALEAGTRNLSIEELILLPLVISNAGGMEGPLIPPEALVLLSRHSHVPAHRLPDSFAALTQGSIVGNHPSAIVTSGRGPEEEAASGAPQSLLDEDLELGDLGRQEFISEIAKLQHRATETMLMRVLYELYPHVDLDRVARPDLANYDLQFKVARRLDVLDSPISAVEYIKPFSFALWGRTFEAERDARADDRGPYESPRSAQAARGHVTREMIGELNKAIALASPTLMSMLKSSERVWQDPEELYKWTWKIARSMGRTAITEVQLETMSAVGEIIKYARESQSLSLSDVSDSSNIPMVWMQWIEAGRPPLDVEQETLRAVIIKACEAVGVDAQVALARLNTPMTEDFRADSSERGTHRKPSRWRRS